MAKLYDTPIRAIRKKCMDCTCNQPKEIRLCTIIDCPLYPYRFGHRPDKATIDTLKEFYEKNTEPARGFSSKKATLSNEKSH